MFSISTFQSLQSNWELHYLEQTDSTNLRAKALVDNTPPEQPCVILADDQNAGRGRRDSRWCSQPAKDLLFTAVLETELTSKDLHKAATTTALALACTLNQRGLQAQIKFPNDLYVDDKKIAGILIEQVEAFTLVGIGLNVNSTPELTTATSMLTQLGRVTTREALLSDILNQLIQKLSLCQKHYAQIRAEIAPLDMLNQQSIEYTIGDKTCHGVCHGLSAEGYMLIDHGDGPREVHHGHSFRIRPA